MVPCVQFFRQPCCARMQDSSFCRGRSHTALLGLYGSVSYEYKLPIQIICGFVFVPSRQRLSDLWQKFVCMLGKSFSLLEPGVPSHDITELGLGKPLSVSVGLLALGLCVFISAYPYIFTFFSHWVSLLRQSPCLSHIEIRDLRDT